MLTGLVIDALLFAAAAFPFDAAARWRAADRNLPAIRRIEFWPHNSGQRIGIYDSTNVSPISRTVKLMEGAHVEMIEMRVRKKHDVDVRKIANAECGRGQASRSDCKTGQPDPDPRKKNRVSKDLDPEKIDEHRCVPEPCRG